MKVATVSVSNQKPSPYFLIENDDDALEYQEFLSEQIDDTINKVFKTTAPTQEWHKELNSKHHGDSALNNSLRWCEVSGGSPLLTMPILSHQKVDRIRNLVTKHNETVLINSVGGYCLLGENDTVFNVESYTKESKRIHYVGNHTKVINFENDPQLEERVKAYFKEQGDTDPSYILNLRFHSKTDIINILNEFASNGGEHVYVYTTGIDTEQMKEYIEAVSESNINTIVFEFNAGINDNIQEIIDSASSKINITIL